MKTVEAILDEQGWLHLLEAIPLKGRQKVLVTLLEPSDDAEENVSHQVEPKLARDWLNEDENAAWEHLQPEESS